MDKNWVVVSKIFYFHPYLGKIPNLTNIFQRGCNHQPENLRPSFWKLGFLRDFSWKMTNLLDFWIFAVLIYFHVHQLQFPSLPSGGTPLTESLQTVADHCKGDVFLGSWVGSVLMKCSLCWLIVANIKPYQNSFRFLDTNTPSCESRCVFKNYAS